MKPLLIVKTATGYAVFPADLPQCEAANSVRWEVVKTAEEIGDRSYSSRRTVADIIRDHFEPKEAA